MEDLLMLFLDAAVLAAAGAGLLGGRCRRDALFLPTYFAAFLAVWTINGRGSYLILPGSSWVIAPLLLIPVLLINSLLCREGEGVVLWGTVAELALYLLLQEAGTAALTLLGSDEAAILFGGPALALLGMAALPPTGLFQWLRERLAEGDTALRVVSGGALLALFALWVVQGTYRGPGQLWTAAAISVAGIAALGGGLLLREQRRLQETAKVRLMERYLPMVEELVDSVRARQHEYSNRVMSVSAAVNTATTLEEAKAAVAKLTDNLPAGDPDRELLRCDSKLISGLIFGKSREAELRHVTVEARIAAPFLHRSLTEGDLVDLTGILLDNAIEAAPADSAVILSAAPENGALRLTVSNPAGPKSAVELTQMFRRGFTTKEGGGRGYGLYNLRRVTEKCGGKVIAKNEAIGGVNHLTIGVIIP